MAAASALPESKDPLPEKVASIKHFFLEYYMAHMTYLKERTNRRQELEGALKAEGTSAQMTDLKRQALLEDESMRLRSRRKRMKITDFDLVKMIGKGGYGEVYLVRRKGEGEILALKRMSKEFILSSEKEVAHIRTERNVLAMQQSPWLVQLVYSFQDATHVYMAMEYAPGGDVRTLLSNQCPFPEPEAKYYMAEMFKCVQALHREGYLHRDLKPENFLIDAGGHLKLTDFGLSKGQMATVDADTLKGTFKLSKEGSTRTIKACKSLFGSQRSGPRTALAYSLVGSPDYMAYEMLTGEGYDFTVDYWALACILFEMLTGFPPFAGESIEDVFSNVYHWEQTLNYGDIDNFMTRDCWALIRAILTHTDKRLGKDSFQDIENHVFFKGIDFSTLRSNHIPAFVPELTSEVDTQYFDEYDCPNGLMAANDIKEIGSKRTAFHAFTYQRRKKADSK